MNKINGIAIIDDDPITTFGLKKLLSFTSEESTSIEDYINGKIAIDNFTEKVNKNQLLPEVIFLDINMPIMDGWEFLKAFLRLPITQKIRVNIVTSSIDPYDINQFEFYSQNTQHTITFNQKPITKAKMESITKVA